MSESNTTTLSNDLAARWRFMRTCDSLPSEAVLHLLKIESSEELIELKKLAAQMNTRMVLLVDAVINEVTEK